MSKHFFVQQIGGFGKKKSKKQKYFDDNSNWNVHCQMVTQTSRHVKQMNNNCQIPFLPKSFPYVENNKSKPGVIAMYYHLYTLNN